MTIVLNSMQRQGQRSRNVCLRIIFPDRALFSFRTTGIGYPSEIQMYVMLFAAAQNFIDIKNKVETEWQTHQSGTVQNGNIGVWTSQTSVGSGPHSMQTSRRKCAVIA